MRENSPDTSGQFLNLDSTPGETQNLYFQHRGILKDLNSQRTGDLSRDWSQRAGAMSDLQYITLMLCAIGSPVIGFLFGASWGYVQANRQEVDTFSLVLCVIACGSFFCLLGFLATMASLFFLR